MKLDRDGSGTIDKDEFLLIPQIANNPLASRMIAIFDEECVLRCATAGLGRPRARSSTNTRRARSLLTRMTSLWIHVAQRRRNCRLSGVRRWPVSVQ